METNKGSGQFQFLNADNALEQNIKKVLHDRIDATVESPAVMNAKLKELGLKGQLVSAGRLASSEPMYIACSPAKELSKKLATWVDEGTRKMRKSGELQKIMEKYGLSDWKE